MGTFSVIGIGPGHPDYLLPLSKEAAEEADLLMGAQRHLELFAYADKRQFLLKGNYKEAMDYIKENRCREKIAVLVSGDPGYHSLLGMVSRHFDNSEYKVYPGLSSFQVAMTKTGRIWNDARLISLHGKDIETALDDCSGKMVLLTDKKNTPQRIARHMMFKGQSDRTAIIAENLTYENENIRTVRIGEIKEEEYQICVMIIE